MLDYAANFAERNICFSIAEEEVISITCFLFELLIGIMPCLSLKSLIRHTHTYTEPYCHHILVVKHINNFVVRYNNYSNINLIIDLGNNFFILIHLNIPSSYIIHFCETVFDEYLEFQLQYKNLSLKRHNPFLNSDNILVI